MESDINSSPMNKSPSPTKISPTVHLSFNIIGALVFCVLGFAVFMLYPSMAVHEITAMASSISSRFPVMIASIPRFTLPMVICPIWITSRAAVSTANAGDSKIRSSRCFKVTVSSSYSIAPYTDAPIFSKAFEVLGGNPFLGMLIGALVTALLQSFIIAPIPIRSGA